MTAEGNISFSNGIINRETAVQKIEAGEFLILAGDEKALSSLPSGNWIAGSSPYSMTDNGGQVDQEQIFATTIRGVSSNALPRITLYDVNSISRISQEAPKHGFTVLILPAGSDVHLSYAQNAPEYPNMFFSPIVGWIAGMHLSQLGETTAKIGFGPASGMLSDQHAVAMHVPLGEDQAANIKTINLFDQGSGPIIKFPETGFSASKCLVDGQEWSLSDYIKENNIDTRLPLVANYSGVMINVSIQEVLDSSVNLYAPVFAGLEYHFAKPVTDYVTEFEKALPTSDSENIGFSCNCILNFLYSELEGKKTGKLTGPITFGEIAYQLVNQTLVYMTLDKV